MARPPLSGLKPTALTVDSVMFWLLPTTLPQPCGKLDLDDARASRHHTSYSQMTIYFNYTKTFVLASLQLRACLYAGRVKPAISKSFWKITTPANPAIPADPHRFHTYATENVGRVLEEE